MKKITKYAIIVVLSFLALTGIAYAIQSNSIDSQISKLEEIKQNATKTADYSRKTQEVLQNTIDQLTTQLVSEKSKEENQKSIYKSADDTINSLKTFQQEKQ